MSTPVSPLPNVKALTFDVFGTTVNWRTSIESALTSFAAYKLSTLPKSSPTHARLSSLTPADWTHFAQQWRNAYGRFTSGFQPGVDKWIDIDTHHEESLRRLLGEWDLGGLCDDDAAGEVHELSRAWHRLVGWEDSGPGLRALGSRFVTSTLSNGNQELLRDLDEFAFGPAAERGGKEKVGEGYGFRKIISAADFGAYKPHPLVYKGAVEKLGLQMNEVAMVASHLGDLAAARELGMRTIYTERHREEAWERDGDKWKAAKEWVDVWVDEDEGGFLEAARRLGVDISSYQS